jgi:hypothetical protein
MENHFLDLFAFFLFLRASPIDSRIWAKARLRVLGERGASEEDDDEEDEVEGLLLILRGFFCPALGARPWRSGEGLIAPDGPAVGLPSPGAVGMDSDREDRDRRGSASAPSMALTGEQDSLLIWRYSSRRGVCGDGGPAVMGESDWRGAGGVAAAGRGRFTPVCLGGVTCLRGLGYSWWGPGVDWRRRGRDSLGAS